jgi:hypothetical protein
MPPDINIKSYWMKSLNVQPTAMKLPEENMEEMFCVLSWAMPFATSKINRGYITRTLMGSY